MKVVNAKKNFIQQILKWIHLILALLATKNAANAPKQIYALLAKL